MSHCRKDSPPCTCQWNATPYKLTFHNICSRIPGGNKGSCCPADKDRHQKLCEQPFLAEHNETEAGYKGHTHRYFASVFPNILIAINYSLAIILINYQLRGLSAPSHTRTLTFIPEEENSASGAGSGATAADLQQEHTSVFCISFWGKASTWTAALSNVIVM